MTVANTLILIIQMRGLVFLDLDGELSPLNSKSGGCFEVIIGDVALGKFVLTLISLLVPFAMQKMGAVYSITVPYIFSTIYSGDVTNMYAGVIVACLCIDILLWFISVICLRIRRSNAYFIGLLGFAVVNMLDVISGVLTYIEGTQSADKIINILLSATLMIMSILAIVRKRKAGDSRM